MTDELNENELSAEMAVVGSCLIERSCLEWAYYNIPEEEFISKENKKIFQVLKRMHKAGTPVDVTTVEGNLTGYEKKSYWHHVQLLTEKVQSTLNVRHYGEIMHKNYVVSELNKRYEKIKSDPFNIEVQKEIRGLWDSLVAKQNSIIPISDMALKYPDILMDRKSGKSLRILSGYPEFDALTGGFHQGNLVVLGARTSVGKTSFLLNLCIQYMEQNLRILFISAEMLFDELMDRMVSMKSSVYISKLRSGNINDIDNKQIHKSLSGLHGKNFWCLDGGRMGVNRIRTAVEIVKPEVIFVDFIQRFTPPSYNIPRAAYLSDVANELKDLAKEKRIVVIAASQLNRDIEKSDRPDPRLSDYKDSGGIEESADYSLMLVADKESEDIDSKLIKVHINKARSGPCGVVEFGFQKSFTLFTEIGLPTKKEEDVKPARKPRQTNFYNGDEN